MRTVEKLDQILRLAKNQGFEVRFEYLTGNGGGLCTFNGKNWLFIDLAQSVTDQLETIEQALHEVAIHEVAIAAENANKVIFGKTNPADVETLTTRRAA